MTQNIDGPITRKQKLRIGVISDTIYPWTKGGAELRYFEIYRRIALKQEIHYYTMKHPGMNADSFQHEAMRVYCVTNAPKTLYTSGRRKIIPALMFSIKLLLEMRGKEYDVIDVNETPFLPLFCMWIYRLLHPSTKIVAVWHEHWDLRYWQCYLGKLAGTVGFLIQQLAIRIPDCVFCVSDDTKKRVLSSTRLRDDRIRIIGNGVDCKKLQLIRSSVESKHEKLVFVGRLIPEKRVDKFIQLVRMVSSQRPRITATVIGDGPQRSLLESMGKNLPIVFRGSIESHEDVLREVAESSALVSFSIREGFNISALEACQLGVRTFLTLRLFSHANLHPVTRTIVEDIISALDEPLPEVSSFDKRYCWVEIADSTEYHLRKVCMRLGNEMLR